MRNWRWRWLLLLLVTVQTVRAADYGEISVRVLALSVGGSERGYQEYRATIVNRSASQTRRVTLVLPDQSYGARGNVLREMTRTVEVAPQATAVVSLFTPALDLVGTGARVLIDGRTQEPPLAIEQVSHNPIGFGTVQLLASREISKSRALEFAESYLRNSGGKAVFTCARSDLPVQEWSTHWLGYTQYQTVLLTAAEWQASPDGVRQALWRYLESGGTLLVFGNLEVPAQWLASRATISHTEEAAVAAETEAPPSPATSSGKAVTATPSASPNPAPLPPVNIREDLQSYDVGFGKLFVMPAQPQPALTPAQWRVVESAWEVDLSAPNFRRYNSTPTSFEQLNSSLPLIEKLTTPVRGLFLLMLLFVVVIGPVNLLVLARRRKKLWLLWTVPAISLVTCLAIAGYAIVSEGVSGYARTFSLTLLDEQAHRATTLGFTGFYSPLTPSDGLRFSTETELLPVLPSYYLYNERAGTPRTLDWTNEQHLTSGWVAARVPVWFRLRKSESRRERLSVSLNAKGVPLVTNGLGVPIRRLWLPNEKRALFEAHDIAPGAQVELKQSQGPITLATMKPMRTLLAADWLDEINKLPDRPEEWLAPGTYLAELEEAPFIEPGLQNVRQRKALAFVYGIR